MSDVGETSRLRGAIQWIGLIADPLLAAVCYVVLPTEYRTAEGQLTAFMPAGRVTLAVMVWMAVWWLTEAIPISATALLPLVVFPLFGAAPIEDAAAPYAHPLIFLFMGGFLIALSMQRWGLDRRIALNTLRLVGTRPTHMIAGFMLATAVLSAFVSNTATTAMMLPVALSVIRLVSGTALAGGDNEKLEKSDGVEMEGTNFALCMLLGLAYSASLGGLATIIGSPPNAFLVGFVDETISEPYRMEVTFARWLLIGLPLSITFLPITWFLLTHVLYPVRIRHVPGGRALIRNEIQKLGPTSRGERLTIGVFLLTAGLWIFRPLLVQWRWPFGEQAWYPFSDLTDAGIAMLGGLLLFALPVNFRQRRFAMDWQTTKGLPWDVLLLFGGGLSLASAVQVNGVTEFIGGHASYLVGAPPILVVLVVATTVIFLTELTSNTATTTTLLPVLAALAPGLGIHPYLLIFPAAIAASCAFMMPVATPPNAIVFASGKITIPQMIKAGFWLNWIGVLLVTVLTFVLLELVLGVELY